MRYLPVSTAEKRAQLEAAGESWPIGSDGLPKIWNARNTRIAGGEWVLRSRASAHAARYRKSEKSRAAHRAYLARYNAQPHVQAEKALRALYRIRIPAPKV